MVLPSSSSYPPKKPGKTCIVYDCSATYQGVSLNDTVVQGPDLSNKLNGVLPKFRQDNVPFMADTDENVSSGPCASSRQRYPLMSSDADDHT